MEKIIRLLSKHFKVIVNVGKLSISLSILDKENARLSTIRFVFNEKRFSYSILDYRNIEYRKFNFISKHKLNLFIKNLISHPVFNYKKINKF